MINHKKEDWEAEKQIVGFSDVMLPQTTPVLQVLNISLKRNRLFLLHPRNH
jgi:hypothetical protein